MAETTTTKPVNLYQLGQEIGGSPGFRMVGPDNDDVYVIRTDDVDQAKLDAAVNAHKPDASIVFVPPTPETVPEPITIDPDDLAQAQSSLAKATTVSGIKNVLSSFFDALS